MKSGPAAGVGELLTPAVIDEVRRRHGDSDESWLRDLPSRVERCAARWDAELSGLLPLGSYAVLLTASARGHGEVVIKVASDTELLARECAALRAWDMSGAAVRLLDVDLGEGAALLERVVPGRPVSELPPTHDVDCHAGEILVRMQTTHDPEVSLPSLAEDLSDLVRRQTAAPPPFLPADVQRAEELLINLRDLSAPSLVHGDFHDDNVLDAGTRGLVAIDPRPCIGDPAADAGNWAVQRDRARTVVPRMTALAAALGADVERVRGWARVMATIVGGSLARFGWGDPGDAERFLAFARTGRGSDD